MRLVLPVLPIPSRYKTNIRGPFRPEFQFDDACRLRAGANREHPSQIKAIS